MRLILNILFGLILVLALNQNFVLSQVAPNASLPAAGTIPQVSGLYQGTSIITTVSLIIKWALGFIGIVIFIIFLFAGFEYATAGGDDTKAQAATKRMTNAIIGLIIVFFTFVLSNTILGFVFNLNTSSTNTTTPTNTSGTNTTR